MIFFTLIISFNVSAQNNDTINNALAHQPALKEAQINELITKASNAINLSGLYPQINASGSITHFLELPTSYTDQNGVVTPTRSGIANTAVPGFSLSRAVFSPAIIYAIKVAPLYVKAAHQITDSAKINLVVALSKSF